MAAVAVALWLIVVLLIPAANQFMGSQATVRPLAEILKSRPDIASAQVFASARAHGIEFYLERLICHNVGNSDLVLPPDAEQKARLRDSTAQCLQEFAGQPAYGLVTRNDLKKYQQSFPPWRVLGEAGKFVLITSGAESPK
jgi:hypothetical protein